MSDAAKSKGFNDDELADIMNEIESLEKDFNEEVDNVTAGEEKTDAPVSEVTTTPEPEASTTAEATSNDDATAETETETETVTVAETPAASTTAEATASADNAKDNVVSIEKTAVPTAQVSAPQVSGSEAPTEMNFAVAGNMKMALNFKVNNQTVNIQVCGNDGLTIELANGAKFSVPLNKAS